jgi:hypothetical protein
LPRYLGDQKMDRTSFYVTDEIVILFFFETNQQMLGGLKRFLNVTFEKIGLTIETIQLDQSIFDLMDTNVQYVSIPSFTTFLL